MKHLKLFEEFDSEFGKAPESIIPDVKISKEIRDLSNNLKNLSDDDFIKVVDSYLEDGNDLNDGGSILARDIARNSTQNFNFLKIKYLMDKGLDFSHKIIPHWLFEWNKIGGKNDAEFRKIAELILSKANDKESLEHLSSKFTNYSDLINKRISEL